jgi:tetratricopeptide (TPR) repeat protein
MGDIQYQENKWDEAYKTYTALVPLIPQHMEIDPFEVHLRKAVCAQKKGLINEAFTDFTEALAKKPGDFDANFNLGQIEFQRGEFDRAVNFLNRARADQPENAAVLRSLGHAYFKLKRYKDAMNFIRAAIQSAPEDKESLFTLAECYWEGNQAAEALKIYTKLRNDPVWGANACLAAGTINAQQHQTQKAIEDFETGLKITGIKQEVALDIKYRLAVCYLHLSDIGNAMKRLREIDLIKSPYKDVPALISRYAEVNANRNLRTYLMGNAAEFQSLCRHLVLVYYPRAKVKITGIEMEKNEWVDITADIDTATWSDTVMFRFMRSQGSIGEIIVRDFHAHLKEVKAGKGICCAVGTFSDEAKHFTEARLIDLVGKERLLALLNKVNITSPTAAKK